MFGAINAAKKIGAKKSEKNMKQTGFSEKTGVSYRTVSSWERESPLPDVGKFPDLTLFFYSTPLINDSYILK